MSELVDALLFQIRAAKLPTPEQEVRVTALRKFRFDLCWPDLKIAAECDGGTWVGGRHTRGAGFERDCHKMSEAVCAGYRVFRFTKAMIEGGDALNYLERALNG